MVVALGTFPDVRHRGEGGQGEIVPVIKTRLVVTLFATCDSQKKWLLHCTSFKSHEKQCKVHVQYRPAAT